MTKPREMITKLKSIGTLCSRVVGCQYYSSTAKKGEILYFDRNPRNEFDPNAIEARSATGEVVGHLPRHHSAFLAPLIDEGSIFLKGLAGKDSKQNAIDLALEVFLTEKGKVILDAKPTDSDREIIHSIIAAFYNTCYQYSSSTVLNMAHRFETLTRDNVLPQLILLSRLLLWKAKEIQGLEREKYRDYISEWLSSLRTQGSIIHRNVEVLPCLVTNLRLVIIFS